MLRRQRLLGPAPRVPLRGMLVTVDVQTQTLGDSLARRTRGSDSPLMRLATFAPRRGACSGRCGRGTRYPCFVRFRGWASIPTLTTLRAAHSSRPQEGRAVRMMPLPTAAITGYGREDKATVTGRISGRSLALSGGFDRSDRVPIGNRRGGSWSHGAVTGRISGLSRCVPGWAMRK